jgi:acylphosphatase
MPAARFLVSGKVQGVFFRASTRIEADRLGLGGYARNLPDGRVEVLAVGAEDAVRDLAQWLQHGPPQARVDVVECENAAADALTGHFSIR